MKNTQLFIVFCLLWGVSCFAGTRAQRTDNVFSFETQNIGIEIQFVTPKIVHICKYPLAAHRTESPMRQQSFSVVKTPEDTEVEVSEKDGVISLTGSVLIIRFNKKNGQISFFDHAGGNAVFAEQADGAKFLPFNDAGKASFSAQQHFILDNNEAIYGLGHHQMDKLNLRGSSILLKQRYLHACIPIFQSTKGYAVFWDNASPTTVTSEDNAPTLQIESQVAQSIDYYFMYGGSGEGNVRLIRELTGQAPMFPLWTYGFWQSRERYRSQYEVVEAVKKYRELGVPLDGIIQDWQYWGGNTNWNSMNFDNPEFPAPQAMIDSVHNLNAKLMISVWASFGPETKPYKALENKNLLFDFTTWPPSASQAYPPDMNNPSGVRVYDAYSAEARDIYFYFLKKGLYDKGIDAWWLDSTEPDHHFEKESDYDQTTALGVSYRSVLNLFPLMTNMGMYEHLRSEGLAALSAKGSSTSLAAEKRVFLLTRCAFAGQQRFAAQTWSGDVESTWQALREQIPSGLNFSLSGIPYWNSDIGGFFLNDYAGKTANKAYLELYTRWFQYATFTPMLRSHGSDVKKEIYNLGQRGDWVFDSEEKYIRLRYRLLPYIYATAREVTSNAGSFLRALFMDFAQDTATHNIGNEYMFGTAFLVAPVTEPMYVVSNEKKWANPQENFSELKTKNVYLPQKNTMWYDFWTGERFSGGQTLAKQVPIDIIPLYVRAGTVLPLAPVMQYATEKRWDDLEIRIYSGADGSFLLYEDENDNYNYERGQYSTIQFFWNEKEKTLTIGEREGDFEGMLEERRFRIALVNQHNGTGVENARSAKTVIYSGKHLTVRF